jgi:putative FmdB family regulatory protein
VPRYDYRCRTCDATFEVRRSMSESDLPVPCPAGHAETVKRLPVVALGGRATAGPGGAFAAGAGSMPSAGGGCCGGSCGCG